MKFLNTHKYNSNENLWKIYGEYMFLPFDFINSLKLRILRKLKLGDYPHIVNFSITKKCNLKCFMCHIWKLKSKKEVSLEKVEKIFSSKIFRKTRLVKLTGGETTLHSKLPEIIEIISEKSKKAKISINTNCFTFKRVRNVILECLKVREDLIFSMSLDGIGKIHDKVRGVNGAFKEVMKTTSFLEKLKDKYPIRFRYSCTINPINVYELPKIIEFAKSKDTYVGFRLVHINSYYNNNDLQNFKFTKEQLEFLRSYVPKVAENYFKFHIFFRRNIPCFGFVNSVFIDSDGKVHKCIYTRNGIDGENLDKVWNNSFGRRLRSFSKCINCWSDCQTIPDLLAEYLHEKVYQKHKRL